MSFFGGLTNLELLTQKLNILHINSHLSSYTLSTYDAINQNAFQLAFQWHSQGGTTCLLANISVGTVVSFVMFTCKLT